MQTILAKSKNKKATIKLLVAFLFIKMSTSIDKDSIYLNIPHHHLVD